MATSVPSLQRETTVVERARAGNGLALIRVTIGAMFVSVFFENLGKGLYRPAGYAGLIDYYIKNSHSPAIWKAVMGLAASHAAMAAPMQAMTELFLGILPRFGATKPQDEQNLALPRRQSEPSSIAMKLIAVVPFACSQHIYSPATAVS